MTIEQLHTNEPLRQFEFPVAENEVFLANAAVCTLPRKVATAMCEYVMNATQGDQELRFPLRIMAEIRELSANLLDCNKKDIALVAPTSVGLSLIANGIDWKPGDNVVYAPDDYPSNTVVWMALAEKGVELRPLLPEVPGEITPELVENAMDERTRLVALSSVHFISGYRLDVNAVGKVIKKRGALFSLDAIQSIGVLRTPLDYVDFAPADGHKWMLGPCAAGILYVSEEGRAHLKPTLLGWANVVCPDFVTPESITFPDDARRYEAGSYNFAGIIGLYKSLKMLKELGYQAVEDCVLAHTRYIREKVRAAGYELASEDDEHISGITSFRSDGKNMADLHQFLTKARIMASLRSTRDRRQWIRFSPHFFNTRQELNRAVALL